MTSEFGNNGDEDVVEQILSILPPKALMRFKCVSKKWYALIANPRFVATHLSNSMHNNLSTTGVLLKRLVHDDTDTDETNEANTNTSNVTNDEAEEVLSFLHFLKNHDDVRPHLSLLYGYLTEEEREKAQERVSILDESISNLSFPVTRFALYKIGYKDTSLKSWEKIAEYPLH